MTKPFANWDYDDAANAVQAKLALLDMCPGFSALNLGNYSVVDAILTSQLGLIAMFSCLKGQLNFSYLRVGQFRNSVIFSAWRQSDLKRVFRVTGKGGIFQVTSSVIGFYAVYMVDVMSGWLWANEGSYYQRVNGVMSLLGMKTESDVGIAAGSQKRLWHIARLCAACRKVAPDSSEVRNGVHPGVPADNGVPFFGFKFFDGKFVDRQGVNLMHRFVSSLGWGGVRPSFQPL